MVPSRPEDSSSRSTVAVAIVALLAGVAAAPKTDDVANEAAAAFTKLDTAPADGVLTGSELTTVAGYDADADGRVTPEEFARGFTRARPAARWERHEFPKEGFSCEMPGTPEPLDAEGATRFEVAVNVAEPPALLIARMRDMPARAAGKPDPFFDTVVEQIEASGAVVVGRQAADLGLHRGSILAARREDGTLEVVRSVVVGRTVYELHAILSPGYGAPGREAADRFLSSLQLVR